MLTGLTLPFVFDPELLRADLARVAADDWAPHFNNLDFGGVWRGAALRSPSGRTTDLAVKGDRFQSTALLARCPYFEQLLQQFACPLKSVRLLSLAPGSFIREHTDDALDFEDGEARIHVPLQTGPGVEFYLAGERLSLEEGRTYYVNVNLPHRVTNRGNTDRIHLVIDADVNPWLRGVFTGSGPIQRMALPALGLDLFRAGLVAHPELRSIPDRRSYLEAVLELSRDAGYSFCEADLDAAYRTPSGEAPGDLAGWIPCSLRHPDSGPALAEWLHAPGERFTDPFFEDSIRRFRFNPHTVFTRCLAPLPASAAQPAGFIFHLSRCGSTLISRTLAVLPRVTAISEAPPIDQILRSDAPEPRKIEWLRDLIGAFASARNPPETHCIIKLDAWHMANFPLIRKAFPDTPWIFSHRDPLEVLVSHQRRPGLHMTPPGAVPSLVDFRAGVLTGILQSAARWLSEPGGLFANYTELPAAIGEKIAPHFGLRLSDSELELLRGAASLDAKNPTQAFAPDSRAKQEEASELRRHPAVRELTSLWSGLFGTP